MKRSFTLLALLIAWIGTAMAYDHVVKETHWFGIYDYYDGGKNTTHYSINWSGNYLESIQGYYDWDGYPSNHSGNSGHYYPKTSYYSWIDHSLRFRMNVTGNWEISYADNTNYSNTITNFEGGKVIGIGLHNKSNNATNFVICGLKAGEEFNIEYYRANSSGDSPFVVEGSANVQNVTPLLRGDYNKYSDYNGTPRATGLSGIGGDSNPVFYKVLTNGDVEINVPSHAVIRSVTIKHVDYPIASYDISKITGTIGDKTDCEGYEVKFTGAGVLEEKTGAVPYITMSYGNANDMTFVRNLGSDVFGASCIIDGSNNFNPGADNTTGLMSYFRGMSEADVKKMNAGKEWSLFSANASKPTRNGYGLLDYHDDFGSIIPCNGSYYYFFPAVDGKLNMKFYCEGNNESVTFYYKKAADGTLDKGIPAATKNTLNGTETHDNMNVYEFECMVEKGGTYYLCSLPTDFGHQHPVIRLLSYSFIPAFDLNPLWSVATDAEKAAGAVSHAAELNQDFTVNGTINIIKDVRCEGNIQSATARFDGTVLKIENITYKSGADINKGGVVMVDVECENGKATHVLTVPYSAEKAVASTDANQRYLRVKDTDTTRNPNGKEVKKWDFFSQSLALGKGTDTNSQLYSEMHQDGGVKSDWTYTYMNLTNNSEPIYKSTYDMEGDNADMVKETEGLLFFANSNEVGIFNDNDPSTSDFVDRYVGFVGGGEMWIPSLKAGDRIVIKMGRWGNCATDNLQEGHVRIDGATDAIGNAISTDYVFGGSDQIATLSNHSIPYGEYHFISTGGHFKLKVADVPLLKLYSVVIYRNSINNNFILTENTVNGENRGILYTDKANEPDQTMSINLHLSGKGEPFDNLGMVENYRTGMFLTTTPTFSTTDNKNFTYTPSHSDRLFGAFRQRLGVRTKDADSTYVTDYADYNLCVGYRETKQYPYTWDFTDLKKYVASTISDENDGTESAVTMEDMKLWSEYGMRICGEETNGALFMFGGQFYAGQTMFPESAGIGIEANNYDSRRNGVMKITGSESAEDGGLAMDDRRATEASPLLMRFIVPQVAEKQAVYVRAKKVSGAKTSQMKYDLNGASKQSGNAPVAFQYVSSIDGEDVFAMTMAAGASVSDVNILAQGYEVKKIAVATDEKSVNVKGYASECRAYAVDHALTAYFLGKDATKFHAYMVSSPNYTDRTLTLTDIASSAEHHVMAATAGRGSDHNAVVLQYEGADTDVNVLNGKFHLFVPDMHDETELAEGDNLLVPTLENIIPLGPFEDDMTNYVLSYKYYQLDENGNPVGDQIEGEEMFYRVSAKGINVRANSAFLQLPTAKVKPSSNNPAGAPIFTFLFRNYDDMANPEETTAITTVEQSEEKAFVIDDNAVWYTINGQRLNGRPTQRGVYIVAGRKVVVK